MRSISDEEVDKVFQEAASKVQYPFDPDAWEKMSAMLEKPGFLVRLRRLLPWASLFLVIPSAFMVWLALGSGEASTEQGGPLTTQPATTTSLAEVHSAEGAGDPLANKSKNEQVPDRAIPSSLLAADVSMASVPRVKMASGFGSSAAEVSTEGKNGRDPIQPSPGRMKTTPGASIAMTTTVTAVSSNEGIAIGEIKSSASARDESLQGTPGDVRSAERVNRLTPVAPADSAVAETPLTQNEELKEVPENSEDSLQLKEKISVGPGRWAVRLALSPDFTTLDGAGVEKLGINAGLMIDFTIHPRVVLSAGAIYSRKKYTGYDIEYPYNSTTLTADELYGDCRMLDIPVNIYYRFKPAHRTSFFAGVGLTSYVLFQEDYTYYRETGYGTRAYYQSVDNENRDWFSQLNVSAGIEKQIRPNLSFQVEPFLKAPLSGVGEGQVKLTSYGAFFLLRYHFNK
jgi:hypothetical protein